MPKFVKFETPPFSSEVWINSNQVVEFSEVNGIQRSDGKGNFSDPEPSTNITMVGGDRIVFGSVAETAEKLNDS